jgi:predicted transcriptional regulator
MNQYGKVLYTLFFLTIFTSTFAQRFEWMEIYSGSTFSNSSQATKTIGNNVYTAGEFRGSVSFGSTVLTSSGTVGSIYIANYDTLGNFRWAVKGGSDVNSETFRDFDIDQYGNLYLSGLFTQSTQWGSLTLSTAGAGTSSFSREGFIVKLDAQGTPQWIKGIYSPNSSFGFNDLQKISVADSTVYFGGILSRSIRVQGSTLTINQATSPFFSNLYVGKIDLNGAVVSLDKIANTTQSSSAFIGDLVGISNTEFAISGTFRNSYTFGSNNRSVNVGNQSSLIVAKFNGLFCDWASSSTTTATFTSSNTAPQLVVCSNGDITVAGAYRTSLTIQGQTITNNGSLSSFDNFWYAARFDNLGNLVTLKGYDIFGSNPTGIVENSKNELIIVGSFSDSLIVNGNKKFSNGGNDLLVLNVDDRLDENWFQTGGGGNFDYGLSVASSNSANVYILGTFNGLSQFGSTFFSGISNVNTTILIKMSECGTTPIPLTFLGDTNLCQGQSVRILANPSSASTFQWLNNNSILTGEVFRDLFTSSAGNYSVIVNGSGCVDTSRTVTVSVGTPPTVSLNLPDTVCESGLPFPLTGGLPAGGNYSGPGVVANQFNPSLAGIGRQRIVYTFSNGGCADSAIAFIFVKPAPSIFFAPLGNVCISSGPIILSNAFPLGGTFTGTAVTGNQFDPSVAGGGPHVITYSFTDGNGCVGTRSRTITVDTVETANFSALPTFCANETAYTLTEGSPVGGVYQGNGVVNGVFDPAIAGPGTFTINYIVSNQCDSDTAQQTVTVNPAPTVSLGAFSSVCEGSGTITLSGGSPSGGTYSGIGVNGTLFDPSISGSGTFKIYYELTNGVGCSSRDSSTITVDPLPVVSVTNDTAICEGSTVSLSAFGGTTYLWSTSATTATISVTPTATTKYYVTVTGSGNCTSLDSVTVSVNPAPTATISGTNLICEGSSTTLTASGGTAFTWSNAATTSAINVSPLTTTTYTVTISDANGCTATASETITVNPAPTVTLGSFSPVCEGSSAFALSGGLPAGGTYSGIGVNNAQFDPSVSGVGTFKVYYDYTDGVGCSSRDSSTITVDPLPVVSLTNDTAICEGSTVSLSASGGTTYLWSTSATTATISVTPTATTKYYVTVTGSGNCTSLDSVTVSVNPAPTATISGTNLICEGSSTTLTASGGTAFTWSNAATTSAINVSPLTTTTYTVTISDANGCTATASEIVTVNTAPTVTLGSFSPVCEGSSAFALSGGLPAGGTYSGIGVNNAQFDPSVSGVGTFKVYYDYTDGVGCSSRDSSTITVDPLPVVSLTNDTAICEGSTVSLSASGGTTYLWSTSATTATISVTPTATTKYYVTVTGSGNCSSIDSVTVSVSALPTLSTSGATSICLGDTIQLSATSSATTYLWSTNETTPSISVSPLNTTQYIVQTSNGLNCTVSDTITVTVNTGILLNIGPDVILDATNNTSVTYSARAGFTRYLWQDNSTGRSLTVNYDPAKSGTNDTISVIAFNSTGCPSVDTAIVTYDINTGVNDEQVKADVLIYPNPVIDEMIIDFKDSHSSDRLISIYDVEGRLVFQMNSNVNNSLERIRLGNDRLENGVYTVTIQSKDKTTKRKILIH